MIHSKQLFWILAAAVVINVVIFQFSWYINYHIMKKRVNNEEKASNKSTDISCRCDDLINWVIKKQTSCMKQSNTIAEVCLEFSSDYEYLWPFLIHHLSIGFSRIHLYNNDRDPIKLYSDAGIGCLAESGFLHIKPWPGAGVQNDIQNDCFKMIKSYTSKESDSRRPTDIWGANIDVDEYIVLHKNKCIGELLDQYPSAPAIVFNWAMFPPVNISYINPNSSPPPAVHPFEVLTVRAVESVHLKSMARVNCVSKWSNPHYPELNGCAGFNGKSVDLLGRNITPGKRPPPRLPNYEVAQLNHYWTYNFRHFLRKMHRGESFYSNMVYRSSHEYFEIKYKTKLLVEDKTFLAKYRGDIMVGETLCPHLHKWTSQYPEYNLSISNSMKRLNLVGGANS